MDLVQACAKDTKDINITKLGNTYTISFIKPESLDINILSKDNFLFIFERGKKKLFQIKKVFTYGCEKNLYVALTAKKSTFLTYLKSFNRNFTYYINKDGNIFVKQNRNLLLRVSYTKYSKVAEVKFFVIRETSEILLLIDSIQYFLDVYYNVTSTIKDIIYSK